MHKLAKMIIAPQKGHINQLPSNYRGIEIQSVHHQHMEEDRSCSTCKLQASCKVQSNPTPAERGYKKGGKTGFCPHEPHHSCGPDVPDILCHHTVNPER